MLLKGEEYYTPAAGFQYSAAFTDFTAYVGVVGHLLSSPDAA
jgi:hypothetical protein